MKKTAIPAGGIKRVVSIRLDRQTLEVLDEYAGAINEKMSAVARGFIIEGLERAGMGMSSDELHELTRLRMKEELSTGGSRIKKEVRKGSLKKLQSAQQDLSFWLSRPAEERIAAVDYLRRQHHGSGKRLQRVARVLNEHEVEYVIVGAYALAFHGVVRSTGDIDILVRPSPENAGKILTALVDFGFGSLGLNPGDFLKPDYVVQLGFPPVRVDILTSITGVTWQEADEGKVEGSYGGVSVDFLGREQYIANKRALGRKRDLADLEALGEE